MIPRAFGPLSSGAIAAATEVTVASLANPAAELALIGSAVPQWAVCKTVGVGTDDATWYRLDATTGATNVPYVVASLTAGLKWVAIAGRYVNEAMTINGALSTLSGLTVSSNSVISGTETVTGVLTAQSSLAVNSNATVTGILTASSSLTVASTTTLSGITTVVDGNFSIVGSASANRTLKFEVDAQSANADLTFDTGAQTADRTLSVPVLTASATFMVLSETQTITGTKTFSAVTTISNTTTATGPTVGALVIGNGSAGTSVSIGAGIICAGASVKSFQSSFGEQGTANDKQVIVGYSTDYEIYAVEQGVAFRDLKIQKNGGAAVVGTDPGGSNAFRIGGALTINSNTLLSTKTSFTNGAGASLGTLATAPSAGNPTKWIAIDDNGVTRYIPAW